MHIYGLYWRGLYFLDCHLLSTPFRACLLGRIPPVGGINDGLVSACHDVALGRWNYDGLELDNSAETFQESSLDTRVGMWCFTRIDADEIACEVFRQLTPD